MKINMSAAIPAAGKNDRGSALAVVLMTLMFLIALGMAAMTFSLSATLTGREIARFEQDYYTAESALQFTLGRLQSDASPVPSTLADESAFTALSAFMRDAARDASDLEIGGKRAKVTGSFKKQGGAVLITLRSVCGGRAVEAELAFTAQGYSIQSYRELGSEEI